MLRDVKSLVLNNIERLISHNDTNKDVEFSFQIFEGSAFLFIETGKLKDKKLITNDLTDLNDMYIYLYQSLKNIYIDDSISDKIKLLKIVDYAHLDKPNLELVIRCHHNNKVKVVFESTPYTQGSLEYIENDWLELLNAKRIGKSK